MNDSRHTMVQERRDMGKKDIDGGIDLGIGIGIGLDPGPGSPQRMSFFPTRSNAVRMIAMELDGTECQTFAVLEIGPIRHHSGEAIAAEGGVEALMVPAKMLHGKIGRGGISKTPKARRSRDMFPIVRSWH